MSKKPKSLMTVVVCTRNRAESLRDTLHALRNQYVSSNLNFEILVVDNNSKDNTKQIVMEAAAESPWPMRYEFEPQEGLSHARNKGIAGARGDLIAFTDDDVIPEPDWIDALWTGFCKYRAVLVGGAILPLWHQTPPEWLLEPDLQHHLAMVNSVSRLIVKQEPGKPFVYGANMAFSRKVFEELGTFRTGIDRDPDGGRHKEDTDMVERILKAGKRIVYEPNAVVYHKVSREHMTLSYLRKNLISAGKAYIRKTEKWRSVPRWLVRECLGKGVEALWFHANRGMIRAIRAEKEFWYELGMIFELSKSPSQEHRP